MAGCGERHRSGDRRRSYAMTRAGLSRMTLFTMRGAIAIAACVLATACQTLTIQPTVAPNAMDTTMSSFRESNADRYIIVTMTDAVFEQLAQGERVDREGELPPLYARFLAN